MYAVSFPQSGSTNPSSNNDAQWCTTLLHENSAHTPLESAAHHAPIPASYPLGYTQLHSDSFTCSQKSLALSAACKLQARGVSTHLHGCGLPDCSLLGALLISFSHSARVIQGCHVGGDGCQPPCICIVILHFGTLYLNILNLKENHAGSESHPPMKNREPLQYWIP